MKANIHWGRAANSFPFKLTKSIFLHSLRDNGKSLSLLKEKLISDKKEHFLKESGRFSIWLNDKSMKLTRLNEKEENSAKELWLTDKCSIREQFSKKLFGSDEIWLKSRNTRFNPQDFWKQSGINVILLLERFIEESVLIDDT